jgi:hypothetical protein
MKKLIIALLTTLLIFGNCRKAAESPSPKNEFDLPRITETGRNILASEINNVVWLNIGNHAINSQYGGSLVSNINSTYYCYKNTNEKNYTFHTKGNMYTKERDDFFSIYFMSKKAPIVGAKYKIGDINTDSLQFEYNIQHTVFYTSTKKAINSGHIIFTKIDTTNKIITGQFESIIYLNYKNGHSLDSLMVKNGRFDLKY